MDYKNYLGIFLPKILSLRQLIQMDADELPGFVQSLFKTLTFKQATIDKL